MSEIQNSRLLRFYGIALLLSHLGPGLTWFQRFYTHPFIGGQFATCWPFLPGCENWPIGGSTLILVSVILTLGSFLAVPFFLSEKLTRFGVYALAALTFLRAFISFSDYGYTGNYHYINLLLIFAYLFLPRKEEILPLLLVGFYFCCSLLKFNTEWLSGAAIFAVPEFIPKFLIEFGCYYVVVLEAVVSWALISSSRRLRLAAIGQFIAFHVVSIFFVGLQFPFIMLCLLSLFGLREIEHCDGSLLERLFKLQVARTSLVVFLLLLLAQIWPRLYSIDAALSGVPRISMVTMLDATPVCQGSALTRTTSGYQHITQLMRLRATRGSCDPVEFLAQTKRLCDSRFAGEPIRFTLRSRRATDDRFLEILNIPDACSTTYPLPLAELFQRQRRLSEAR